MAVFKEDDISDEETSEKSSLLEPKAAPYGAEDTFPDTEKKRGFCGVQSTINHYKSLIGVFGGKFLVAIVCVQWMLKGMSADFAGQANPYLYRAIGNISAPHLQVYIAVIALPWSFKPVMGILSDFVPLFGYHKLSYMLPATLAAATAAGAISFLWPLSAGMMTAAAVMVTFNTALCDLLLEASYSKKIKANPEYGPALVSFIVAGQSAVSIVSSLASGPLIEHAGPQWSYTISMCFCALFLWPLLHNYVGDRRIESTRHGLAFDVEKFNRERPLVYMGAITGLTALGYAVIGMTEPSTTVSICYVAVSSAVLMLCLYKWLSRVIFKVVSYTFVTSMLSPSIGSASYYFSTDTAEQFPGGPHFTPEFYVTAVGVVGSVVSLVAIIAYNRYMTAWKYRSLFYMSGIAGSALSVINVAFYLRLNLRWGIPDMWFVIGEDVIASVVMTWMSIPSFLILSQLCKAGSEASVFAIVAGVSNLGGAISSFIGSWMLTAMHVEPTGSVGDTKQFENLWSAAMVSSLLPLITLPLISWAIPDARQSDDLDKVLAEQRAREEQAAEAGRGSRVC